MRKRAEVLNLGGNIVIIFGIPSGASLKSFMKRGPIS